MSLELREGARVRVRSDVVARVIDGQAIVVTLPKQMMHELSDVGSRVWELLESHTVGGMADVIAGEYGVERERALRDIRVFLDEIEGLGMIEGDS